MIKLWVEIWVGILKGQCLEGEVIINPWGQDDSEVKISWIDLQVCIGIGVSSHFLHLNIPDDKCHVSRYIMSSNSVIKFLHCWTCCTAFWNCWFMILDHFKVAVK